MFETKAAKAETPLDRAIARVRAVEKQTVDLEAKLAALREGQERLRAESAKAILADPEAASTAAQELTHAQAEIELVEGALLLAKRGRFDAVRACGVERAAEVRSEAAKLRAEAAEIERRCAPHWKAISEIEQVSALMDLNALSENPRSVRLKSEAEALEIEANHMTSDPHQYGCAALGEDVNMVRFRAAAAEVGLKI